MSRSRRGKGLSPVDFCLVLGCSITLILVLGFGLAKFMHDFEKERVEWDLQNVCIAHHIRLGVERSDIYRDGETCRVERWR
jgi:hypothetical protein